MNWLRRLILAAGDSIGLGPDVASLKRLYVVSGQEVREFVGRSGALTHFTVDGPVPSGRVLYSQQDALRYAHHCNLESVVVVVLDRTADGAFHINPDASRHFVESVLW